MTPRVQNCSKNDPKGSKWSQKASQMKEVVHKMLQCCTKFYQTASKTNHQLNNNSRQWPGGLREALSEPRPGGLREALSINQQIYQNISKIYPRYPNPRMSNLTPNTTIVLYLDIIQGASRSPPGLVCVQLYLSTCCFFWLWLWLWLLLATCFFRHGCNQFKICVGSLFVEFCTTLKHFVNKVPALGCFLAPF